MQILANRWSYLIGKDGKIIYTQHSGLNEPRDINAMMEAVDKLFAE